MFGPKDILFILVLPALAAGLVALASSRWVGSALGLALAYAIGHWAVAGWPAFPAPSAEQWLLYFVVLALFLEGARRIWTDARLAWVLRLAVLAAILGLVLRPLMRHSWSLAQTVLWISACTSVCVALWLSCDARKRRSGPWPLFHLVWAGVLGGCSIVCVLGGSLKLGQMGMAMTAALCGTFAASLWDRRAGMPEGGFEIGWVFLLSLLMSGFFYASVPWWAVTAVVSAPFGLWLAEVRWVRRLKSWQLWGTVLAVSFLPSGVAIGAMALKYLEAMQPGAGDGYYGY